MGRVPEAELEKLKQQVDLVAMVRAHGVELKKSGKDWVGRCPFHDDKTPSLVVTPTKNLWHCLGACQAGGSVIDWVMRRERVSFKHAVELLRAGDASLLVAEKNPARGRKLPSPLNPYAGDQELFREVIEFYHETLKLRAPEAMKYLESRGIASAEAVDKFKLGFSNRTLGLRLPKHDEMRTRLMELGVIRESGHEHFAGSLVIPVLDIDGNVTEVYGRKITKGLRDSPDHTYLPGPHQGVWNEEGLTSGDVILCEALFDALSFWVHDFRNVTASYGVQGFTKDHLAAFLKYGVRRVYIAYDRDEAGDQAAEKLSKKLLLEGIETLRVRFPRGMDANDFILKVKPARASLKLCVQSAEWLGRLPKRAVAVASSPAVIPTPPPVAEPSSSLAALPDLPVEIFRKPEREESPKTAGEPEHVDHDPPEEPVAAEEAEERSETRLEVPTELRGEDVLIRLGDREYRVRGLKKNLALEVMRVNVRVAVGEMLHVDTLDLYQAKARTHYVNAAALELGLKEEVLKRDLGRVLLKLEELQETELKKVEAAGGERRPVELTAAEKDEALKLLRSPSLLQTILADFARAGVIGEEVNKCVGYLAAVSRKLDDPLAVILQSTSAAGKSSLMEAVLAMVPPEDQVKYSAMTGQSLFYMGEKDLKHKCLSIAEEQGAHQAAYALKLLQSEGEISIASTGKDAATGRLITHTYRVEGPVQIWLTTTATEVDEELLNRCLVLTVNETREQTRAIHDRQRKGEMLEGLHLREERAHVLKLHQNAQRLLRPIKVVNPYAEKLTFLDSRTRTRRDHTKYLALIRSIALLHQYQRESQWTTHRGVAIEYIEVTASDIEIANGLCHQVLGRSLDELPPQTRRLLCLLSEHVERTCRLEGILRQDYRFTRRQVRSFTGWSDFQVQVHMTKLVRLEYVLPHRGGRGQSFVYELLLDPSAAKGDDPMLTGLLDVAKLGQVGGPSEHLTQRFEHQKGVFEGPSSPQIAPILGGSRSPETQSSHGDPAKITAIDEKRHSGSVSPGPIVRTETEVVPQKKGAAR